MTAGRPTLKSVQAALRKHADPVKARTHSGFFRGNAGDVFLGVATPLRRTIAIAHEDLPLSDVARLMRSKIHEERSVSHAILVLKFRHGDDAVQKQIFDFFLKHKGTIRNWDEVDDSAPYIVGPYLMDRSKTLLYRLIKSRSLWDRRIALVATLPMIRKGRIADTLKLTAMVCGDSEDLIHKAMGWMLREVGKKDAAALTAFLTAHYARLPRTALRYAIERFPKAQRQRWLKGPA